MKKIESGLNEPEGSFFNHKGDTSILNALPYKRCTPEGIVIKKDDTCQAFLAVKTLDLDSMNNDELATFADAYTRLNKIYSEPLKLISMSRKTAVPKQIGYWKHKSQVSAKQLVANNDTDSARVMNEISRATINKLEDIEKKKVDLKFYYIVFAENQQSLIKKIRTLQMVGSRDFGLQMCNKEEVTHILYRMNNMNDESE